LNNCTEPILGQDLTSVNQFVQGAIDAGHWGAEFNLRLNKNPFIVITSKGVLFYGKAIADSAKQSGVAESSINDAFRRRTRTLELTCVAKMPTERLPTAAILVEPEKLDLENPTKAKAYYFVYKNSRNFDERPDILRLAAENFGSLLVVNLRGFSTHEKLQMGRTIVHEAAHLFGQDIILGEITGSQISNRNARKDIELRLLDSTFFRSVTSEARYAEWVLKKILTNGTDPKALAIDTACDRLPIPMNQRARNSPFMTKLDTRESLDTLNICLAKRNSNDQENMAPGSLAGRNESYWYFLEGVPQYLEHRYILEGTTGLIPETEKTKIILKQFESYCIARPGEDVTNTELAFHPLLLGATRMHMWEKILGGQDAVEKIFGFNSKGLANWYALGQNNVTKDASNYSQTTTTEVSICQ